MPWSREEKMFCQTTYLETKSFKTASKYMQIINMIMIYYWDKKLKKRLHVLEADIITIKKHWFDVSSSKDAFFNGHVPNDRHCACLSNKWVASIHLYMNYYILAEAYAKFSKLSWTTSYSDMHKYWICYIFCYNSSLCLPFCLIFGK